MVDTVIARSVTKGNQALRKRLVNMEMFGK